jgi:hypothetical protein
MHITLAEAAILHRLGNVEILAPRYEVMFRDGTAAVLHFVRVAGMLHQYRRAVAIGASWALFDLRHVAPVLAHELPGTPARDVPGLVFLTLRSVYTSAAAFIAEAAADGLVATPRNNELQAVAA